MKRILVFLGILSISLIGCSNNSVDVDKLQDTISSLKNENEYLKKAIDSSLSYSEADDNVSISENSSSENEDEISILYPIITKELLNGHSWYEGNSSGIDNQPRSGFSDNQFHDVRGNSLDYDIVTNDQEKNYIVLDFREDVVVDIDISTMIKINQPISNEEYKEILYPIYYKYDGTLMIARYDNDETSDNELISFPLENIINW